MSEAERRAAPRIKAALRIQFVGVDDQPGVCRGDLSTSGVFIEMDRQPGPLGSVHRLRVGSVDGRCEVEVAARVVRLVAVQDLWRGMLVAGVAFQFVDAEAAAGAEAAGPSPASRGEVTSLLLHIARQAGADEAVELEHRWDGTLTDAQGERAVRVGRLSLRGMVLETDAPMPTGQTVRVEIPEASSGRRQEFQGVVGESTPELYLDGAVCYRTTVSFEAGEAEASASGGASLADALAALLDGDGK